MGLCVAELSAGEKNTFYMFVHTKLYSHKLCLVSFEQLFNILSCRMYILILLNTFNILINKLLSVAKLNCRNCAN